MTDWSIMKMDFPFYLFEALRNIIKINEFHHKLMNIYDFMVQEKILSFSNYMAKNLIMGCFEW